MVEVPLMGRRSQRGWDGAELLLQAEAVGAGPALGDRATRDPVELEGRDPDAAARPPHPPTGGSVSSPRWVPV